MSAASAPAAKGGGERASLSEVQLSPPEGGGGAPRPDGRGAGVSSRVRDGMRMLTLESVYSNAYLIIATGAFLQGFASLMGMRDIHLGLLTAIPTLTGIMGLLGAWAAERLGSRKLVVLGATLASRVLWLPLLLLPLLPLVGEARVWVFLLIYLAIWIFAGLANNVQQGWMSDLVPESIRGRYFGHRSRAMNLASIAAMLIGGLVLDGAKKAGHAMEGYIAVFALAVGIGLLALRYMRDQYEPPMSRLERGNFLRHTIAPLRDRSFRHLVISLSILHFGLGFSAPFFVVYSQKELGVTNTTLAMFTVLSLVVGMFFHVVWGAVIDRAGVKWPMLVNLGVISGIPLLYVFSLSGGLGFIWLGWFLTGVSWSAFNTGTLNISFALSPKDGRAYFLAALNITTGLVFFAGSMTSGMAAELIEHVRFTFLGLEIVHYHLLFMVSAACRFAALLSLRRVKDVKNRGLSAAIQVTTEIVYSKLMVLPQMANRFTGARS